MKMTSLLLMVAAATLLHAQIGGSNVVLPQDKGPKRIDVSGYPPEQQKRYPIFEKKCAKCHPVARAINSRFNASEWKRYMKRMIRRPNAGVTDEQADEIYEFLKFYAQKLGVE